jgi:acylphosphatase
MQHVTVIVSGRVQGVGFRWFVVREAEQRGLSGEVCNRRDGTVEVHAEGPRAALEDLVRSLQRGPAGARVTAAEARFAEGPPRHHGFHVTPTR